LLEANLLPHAETVPSATTAVNAAMPNDLTSTPKIRTMVTRLMDHRIRPASCAVIGKIARTGRGN